MSSAELKKVLHELSRVVEPYRIAYELTRGVRVSNSDGAGENLHPSTPIAESHQDHQSGSSLRVGAGSPKAQENKQRMMDVIVETQQLPCKECGKPWAYTTPDGFTILYPVREPYCQCGETLP